MAQPGMPLTEIGESAREGESELHALRVKLDRYFEAAVFILVVTGFVTLTSTGSLDLIATIGVGAALCARALLLVTGRTARIPERWDAWISLGYLLFYAFDYFVLSGSFVTATIHLVLFSMVAKIFSIRRDRDNIYLAVLGFLEILASCIVTVRTAFLPALSFFVVVAVFAFVLLEIRRSWQADRSSALPRMQGSSKRFMGALWAMLGALVSGMMLLGSILFFVLPRVSSGYMGRMGSRSSIQSGFSEEVRLGQIGEIQQSSAVVMHVQFHGAPPRTDLYWRGVSLSLFDGRRWLNPLPRQLVSTSNGGQYDLRDVAFDYRREAFLPRQTRRVPVSYRVLMEPVGANVFFLLPVAVELDGPYRNITADSGAGVYSADRDGPIGTYEAVSTVGNPDVEELRKAPMEFPAGISLRYLQRPRMDQRVRALAVQITADKKNEYDKAESAARYLRHEYSYTLQLPETPPKDPIADFLFVRKKGHCEYFASAMALMLREVGIPSRVVNGFHGGEVNPVTNSYIVRERDAHSWVEVYFGGYGWIPFDPTPSSGVEGGTMGKLGLYLDAAQEFWREWVINYDFGHQHTLSRSGVLRAANLLDSGSRWTREKYVELLKQGLAVQRRVQEDRERWTLVCAIVVVLIALGVSARPLGRAMRAMRLTHAPEKAPQVSATLWYRMMTETTARKGWRKRRAQTPEEFAASIGEQNVQDAVAEFTEKYLGARFNNSGSDAAQLPGLHEAVKTACKSSAGQKRNAPKSAKINSLHAG